jgi:hypothetical protein
MFYLIRTNITDDGLFSKKITSPLEGRMRGVTDSELNSY